MTPTSSRASILAECIRIAGTQHGVIAKLQAEEAGLGPRAIRHLGESGLWARLHPGVFALWTPPAGTGLWHQQLMAAALWLGAGSAVSRRAAGILWGLDGIDAAPIELSTTGRQRAPRKGILVHRVRTLVDDEIVTQKGIPVTSIPRTLLDLAGVVDREALELALESARRRRLLVRQDLVDQLRRSGRTRAGRGALRRLVEQSIPVATESALEAIVWRALVSAGLPSPIRQHDVHDEEGRFVARVDFAYPDALVAVEADGFDFHSGRAAFRRDRARQNALMRLGWSVYRITWQEVTQRADVMVAAVTELLALRGQAPS